MKYIVTKMRRFCGFIAGFVFYISGILKLLDPVGAGLVMDGYFDFLHLGFLDFASKVIATIFALAEALTGAALITGVWRKVTAAVALAMQGFFTLLTLALVIFNPEMDCGCFGEAIHLTHLQTFLKNIMLMLILAGGFIPLRELGRPKKRKYTSFGIVAVSTLAFTVYSWMYIPLVDFTDYDTTSMLQAARGESEEDIYEATFIYEKDGKQQKFDMEHLPDSTWTFVDTEMTVKEEYMDKTVNLSFYDTEGNYRDSLATEGKIMVVSVYDPDMKKSGWEDIARLSEAARETGFQPLVLIADKGNDVMKLIPESLAGTLAPDIYLSDYKTLITLNRSNGGVTYFSDGYLIRKWASRVMPETEELRELQAEAETETMIGHSTQSSLVFQSFLLYVFAVMLLL